MKAKPFQHLKEEAVRYMISSISLEREYMSGTEKDLLDIAFSKVVLSRKNAELDSMEMILLSKALKRLSVRLFEQYGREAFKPTRRELINTAHKIDIARLYHQKKHHPLNDLKKHKKILTA
ncbi:hypothetical protein FLK61_35310 [Paenalkalicoccus suaedae]|uniref:Uncharacterized protein n=1 Tax=Paenalkalicoccus suaedae TaxID=2592382 RepID=A0A859FGK3_9BACI|nr:hypothetical protein [Paenalkalicoccus suaedae]QKS71938.1 hypothetical protein FLK61_35310 [Paenalkalicoccus suaedae]